MAAHHVATQLVFAPPSLLAGIYKSRAKRSRQSFGKETGEKADVLWEAFGGECLKFIRYTGGHFGAKKVEKI